MYFNCITGLEMTFNVARSSYQSEFPFVCPNQCGKRYKHKSSVYKHVKYECGGKSNFKCHVCGKCFSQKVSLKTHLGLMHEILS